MKITKNEKKHIGLDITVVTYLIELNNLTSVILCITDFRISVIQNDQHGLGFFENLKHKNLNPLEDYTNLIKKFFKEKMSSDLLPQYIIDNK